MARWRWRGRRGHEIAHEVRARRPLKGHLRKADLPPRERAGLASAVTTRLSARCCISKVSARKNSSCAALRMTGLIRRDISAAS